MVQLLRLTGLIEGISYLVLLGIAMPMKYIFDMPQPTTYVGMAHGILFTVYIILVIIVTYQKSWKFITSFWALFASLIPFATFVADVKIFRRSDDVYLKRK